MKVTTYGIGGYDPSKPNDNVVEVWDDGQPDPAPDAEQAVTVDPQALTDAQTAVNNATTVAQLRKAVVAALQLLNPT